VADTGLVLEVQKTDWKQTRFVEGPVPELVPGQVLFRVDRFALTANNITYAVAGDMLGYWRFFPCEEGWGRIPVMGFADVIRSTHSEVKEGTRCFGFYPMGRHLVIQPASVSAAQIVDGAAHRAGLAAPYAQYLPTGSDAVYAEKREDQILLMRGLFMTSFLADDFLAEQGYRGARSVLISSASSKTSIALAFQVKQAGRARAVGLTSARNAEFVRKLGFYDQVVLYDDVPSLAKEPAVFVDMAGDGAVTAAVHRHFGDELKFDCAIGATHWSAARSSEALPGPKPEFFFAPAQIVKRSKEWGPQGLSQRIAAAWTKYCDASDAWLHVVRSSGREAAGRVYQETLAGRTHPADGHILSL
jgi:NADPH:quinone reductase-like Zn-dependent oxidoreductase